MTQPNYGEEHPYSAYPLPPAGQYGREYRSREGKKSKVPMVLVIVGLVLLALCGAGVLFVGLTGAAVNEVAQDIEQQAIDKKAGVSIKANTCKSNEFGGYQVTVTIKNSTTETQSYWVQVDLYAADGKTRLGEAHAIANGLKAGATTDVETTGNGDFKKGAKCVIGEVT